MAKKTKSRRRAAFEAGAIRALVTWPRILPFRLRCALAAWLMAWVVAPAAGYRARIRANLAHVMPELPEREVRRLMRRVPANVGRMLTELAAGEEFAERLRDAPVTGPGLAALEEARAAGRPQLLVSGHFGNFDAMRAVLSRRGYRIGAIYRPLNDKMLDAEFLAMLSAISEPVFARGRSGLAKMIRHLRQGNAVAILPDQHVNKGALLSFFGKPAPTALSAAEMALKYDAVLVPLYGIRQPDGSFELVIEEPVPHSDARTMTQALNDSLEARIRQNMDQWLWLHRRWKPERQARRAARKAAGG
ncbi:lysophospholipid acyltransferase family protein [Poseidonocella sp. HB161398]|uniref:lysophospholipid acyltransferase family protein n=1 Tax=Poseidonocella sp. HB161398 TaxID=2320855 RepID=UPI001109F71C|nr:lysophospholipid acyltransferase family protein [Poseidonocella sp. HB161398]